MKTATTVTLLNLGLINIGALSYTGNYGAPVAVYCDAAGTNSVSPLTGRLAEQHEKVSQAPH